MVVVVSWSDWDFSRRCYCGSRTVRDRSTMLQIDRPQPRAGTVNREFTHQHRPDRAGRVHQSHRVVGVPHRDHVVDLLRQTLRDGPDPRAVSGSTRSHATARADPTTQGMGAVPIAGSHPAVRGVSCVCRARRTRRVSSSHRRSEEGLRLRSSDPAGVLIRVCCDPWSGVQSGAWRTRRRWRGIGLRCCRTHHHR